MSFGSDSPGGAAEGIGGNESGIGGTDSDGMGGFGGFGGLGIGNPGSYGGEDTVGAAGFGGGYGGGYGAGDLGSYGGPTTSTQHAANLSALEEALGISPGSFSVGYAIAASPQGVLSALQQAQSPQNVAGAMTAGLIGALGGKFGSTVAGAIGGSLFGPAGAVIGGLIGSKYGKQAAQSFGSAVMAGIRDGTIGTSEDIGAVAEAHGIDRGDAERAIQEGLISGYAQLTGGNMATPAGTQASYQQQALDYLKQREQVPWQLSDAAMKQLGGVYGLPGFDMDQGQFIQGLKQSPIYTAQMGTIPGAEEAVMRRAAATGGLRSGNVQQALAETTSGIERQALMDAYSGQVGGLQGLAGLPSYTPQIASTMAGIGQTQAAGQLASEQMKQAEQAQNIQLALAGYQALGGYEGIGDIASDIGSWLF
jgi:hypothetical protein